MLNVTKTKQHYKKIPFDYRRRLNTIQSYKFTTTVSVIENNIK